MAIRATLRLFGIMLMATASLMGLMVLISVFADEAQVAGRFLSSALVTGFVGGALMLGLQNNEIEAERRDGVFLLFLAFAVFPFFAGLPMIGGPGKLSLLQAWFDATSMWTTTGASLVPDVELLSGVMIFWRALLGWIGGLGIIVVAIALLARLHLGGLIPQLLPMPHGEGDSLMDQARQTARTVAPVYVIATAIVLVALIVVGTGPFDALIYAMGALGTSGIAPHSDGVAGLQNGSASLVIAMGSLFGALSFSLHWRALRAHPDLYAKDPETMAFFSMLIIGIFVVALDLLTRRAVPMADAVQIGIVDAAAFLSTSGYSVSTGPGAMVSLNVIVLMGLMICGGATASTAGGLRPMRLMMLLKQSDAELARLSFPNIAVRMRYGEQRIDDGSLYGIVGFFVLTLGVLVALTLGLSLDGLSFEHALYAALSAFANCGPVLEQVTGGDVTVLGLSDWGRSVYTVGMILGRMEIVALLVFAAPAYWRR